MLSLFYHCLSELAHTHTHTHTCACLSVKSYFSSKSYLTVSVVWLQKTSVYERWKKAKRRKRQCALVASTFRPSWSVPETCDGESSRTAKRKAMMLALQKRTTGTQTEKS